MIPVLLASARPWVGRREGQRLARRELAEVSFWQRILNWIGRLFSGTGSGTIVPRGWFGLIVLAVLAIVAVIVIVTWVRPARARRAASGAVLTGSGRNARDYRAAAERFAASGDFGAAIVECVRAIAAELEERQILPPRPGRTADELGVEAGRALPGTAAGLRTATRLFDDILYGDKDGTEPGYQLVSGVDAEVRSARASAPDGAAEPAGLGVPR